MKRIATITIFILLIAAILVVGLEPVAIGPAVATERPAAICVVESVPAPFIDCPR